MMENSDSCKKTRVTVATQQGSPLPSQGCQNPMLNSLVLQTLFEYASMEEIKAYRQVCRLWWEESLPRWRRNICVNLNEDGGGKFLSVFSYLDMINASASSDPFQFGKHPYRNFKLNSINNMTRLNKAEKIRQLEFWRKCGPKMRHLELSFSTFQSVDDFETVVFRLLPKLVYMNLSTIWWRDEVDKTVELMETDEPWESTINSLEQLIINQSCQRLVPVSWIRFLGQFPRIKTLSLTRNDAGLTYYPPGRELGDILNSMITLAREKGISWNLEILDLLFMGEPKAVLLERRHSELFRQLQLPLRTLCLHIGAGTSRAALRSILETCAYTLRKLVVYSDGLTIQDVGDEIAQDFPYGVQLDTLSELWLSGRLLCDNLNFLPFTPNLTSLILAQDIRNSLLAAGSNVSGDQIWDDITQMLSQDEIDRDGHLREAALSIVEGTDFSRLEHVVIPGLKEFIVSGRQELTCSAYQVAALSRLMPNLTTLMLGLENDSFRAACEGWKQLEVLIVQPFKVDQCGLTGNVPLLKHRLPNLTDLTSLRYFGIGFEPSGRAKRNLTDESVLNAIFPLKNLRGIAAVYNLDKMGVKVRDQLVAKFPESKIHAYEDDVQEWKIASWMDDFDDVEEGDGNSGESEEDTDEETSIDDLSD